MNISGYDSSSIGTLFSSLNKRGSASSGFYALTSVLSDYSSLRSGSYYKLLKAYDGMDANGTSKLSSYLKDKSSKSSSLFSSTATQKAAKAQAQDASELSDSLTALMDKSLYETKTKTDKDGNKTSGYDVDGIYSAVKSYVSDYNAMVESGEDSDTSGVANNVSALETVTKLNRKALANVGITIGSDGKLSVNEDTFKEADMSDVQNLFQKGGSYGTQAASKVSLIENYAKAAASSGTGYTSSGKYNSYSVYSDFSQYI